MSEDFGPYGRMHKDTDPDAMPEDGATSRFCDTGTPETPLVPPPMSDAAFLRKLRGADDARDSRPLGLSGCPELTAILAGALLQHPFERIVRFRHQAQRRGIAVDVAFWEETLHQLILITSPRDREED